MKLETFGLTEGGREHPDNEDSLLMDDARKLYAVADGLTTRGPLYGGGKQASSRTIDYFSSNFNKSMERAVREANRLLYKDRQKENSKGLKQKIGFSTLTAGFIRNNELCVGNVGDSFAFLVRGNSIEEITIPDGVRGKYIYQVMGDRNVAVGAYKRKLKHGDHVLLSTDGMMASLSEKNVLDVVTEMQEPKLIVNKLVEEIKKKPRILNDKREYRDDIAIIDIKANK